MSKRFLLVTIFVLLSILTACSSSGKDDKAQKATATFYPTPLTPVQAEYHSLTLDEFADILANHAAEYTIVNVHTPYAGEIAGTDAFVPYDDVNALTAALPDKNAPIILYCRSGRMSEEASRTLVSLGYTQVWDVPGGMSAWQASGREIVNNKK